MALLNVNIDHVATVRQARMTVEPDPAWAAVECELGGAKGITMHLREDRRHIQERDVEVVKEISNLRINLEMAMTDPMVRYALKLIPNEVTLVPEKREELTTEGGLDCVKLQKTLESVVKRMHKKGVEVSAFIMADSDQIKACVDAGCDAIELHTGPYANAKSPRQINLRLKQLEAGLKAGLDAGLLVHAGHGLTYRNVEAVAALEGFSDFNIGHGIISRSIFTGIRQATKEMVELITPK